MQTQLESLVGELSSIQQNLSRLNPTQPAGPSTASSSGSQPPPPSASPPGFGAALPTHASEPRMEPATSLLAETDASSSNQAPEYNHAMDESTASFEELSSDDLN